MFAQIVAIFIFLGMFLLIILDKFERHYVTLGSGALVLTLVFGVCMHSFHAIWETLNLGAFFQRAFWYGSGEESAVGINWSTIVFIAGMMIMVEGLGQGGLFPLAVPVARKARALPHRAAAGLLYDALGTAFHVYRQHHRRALPRHGHA